MEGIEGLLLIGALVVIVHLWNERRDAERRYHQEALRAGPPAHLAESSAGVQEWYREHNRALHSESMSEQLSLVKADGTPTTPTQYAADPPGVTRVICSCGANVRDDELIPGRHGWREHRVFRRS